MSKRRLGTLGMALSGRDGIVLGAAMTLREVLKLRECERWSQGWRSERRGEWMGGSRAGDQVLDRMK